MGFGLVGDKTGNLGIWVAGGGDGWWRRADDDVLVMGEVMGVGGLRGVWILGSRVTEEREGGCTVDWGKWGKGGGGM
jgi:hypothetical protein